MNPIRFSGVYRLNFLDAQGKALGPAEQQNLMTRTSEAPYYGLSPLEREWPQGEFLLRSREDVLITQDKQPLLLTNDTQGDDLEQHRQLLWRCSAIGTKELGALYIPVLSQVISFLCKAQDTLTLVPQRRKKMKSTHESKLLAKAQPLDITVTKQPAHSPVAYRFERTGTSPQ